MTASSPAGAAAAARAMSEGSSVQSSTGWGAGCDAIASHSWRRLAWVRAGSRRVRRTTPSCVRRSTLRPRVPISSRRGWPTARCPTSGSLRASSRAASSSFAGALDVDDSVERGDRLDRRSQQRGKVDDDEVDVELRGELRGERSLARSVRPAEDDLPAMSSPSDSTKPTSWPARRVEAQRRCRPVPEAHEADGGPVAGVERSSLQPAHDPGRPPSSRCATTGSAAPRPARRAATDEVRARARRSSPNGPLRTADPPTTATGSGLVASSWMKANTRRSQGSLSTAIISVSRSISRRRGRGRPVAAASIGSVAVGVIGASIVRRARGSRIVRKKRSFDGDVAVIGEQAIDLVEGDREAQRSWRALPQFASQSTSAPRPQLHSGGAPGRCAPMRSRHVPPDDEDDLLDRPPGREGDAEGRASCAVPAGSRSWSSAG